MKNPTYSQLLRDPRWQKKRLEIMQRDKFTCQNCKDTESTLNVHHCFYKEDSSPWEYPNSSLITLCEKCHTNETQELNKAKKNFLNALSSTGFRAKHFIEITERIERHWHPSLRVNNRIGDVLAEMWGETFMHPSLSIKMAQNYFDLIGKKHG